MSKQANPMAIGGFVLGALALLVVAILVFGSGALFRAKELYVSYFPGTVQGLNVGAPVQFRGVQVGQVTDIKLDYFPTRGEVLVPVFYEFWPDTIRFADGEAPTYERTPDIVEKFGLRAKLESVSLVTGQYLVSLEFAPKSPLVYRGMGVNDHIIEIPTVEATRDRLADMLQGLALNDLVDSATHSLRSIQGLVEDPDVKTLLKHAAGTFRGTEKLVADLDSAVKPLSQKIGTTLDDYSSVAQNMNRRVTTLADGIERLMDDIATLSKHVDSKVDPLAQSAVGALNRANQAFASVDGLVGDGSETRYDLDLLLREGAAAARSLRLLADYLEQNPGSLLRGKY